MMMMSPTFMPIAEFNPLVLWLFGVALGHASLNIDSAPDSIHDAAEFGQDSVAGILHNPAVMFGDLGIDEYTQALLQPNVRALLIHAAQVAIAGDIGCPG